MWLHQDSFAMWVVARGVLREFCGTPFSAVMRRPDVEQRAPSEPCGSSAGLGSVFGGGCLR
jgi:hypothetical protein